MPVLKISRATDHAIPLLMDIAGSTDSLPGAGQIKKRVTETLVSSSATDLATGPADYYILFEDHFPLGFAGLLQVEDCGELIGPCLYRDCLGKGYGEYLLDHICSVARLKELRLLYVLTATEAEHGRSFLVRHGFESVSSDPEFIKRWRDGLLAEVRLEEGIVLLARLISLDA